MIKLIKALLGCNDPIEERYKEDKAMEGKFRIVPSEVDGKFNIERAELCFFNVPGVMPYIRWERMYALSQPETWQAPLVKNIDALRLEGQHMKATAESLQKRIQDGEPESIWCPEALSADHLFVREFDSIEHAKEAIEAQLAFEAAAAFSTLRERTARLQREDRAIYIDPQF